MSINNILNEEDINFLKELSYKLKTQDDHSTRTPLIFQIADYKITPVFHDQDAEFAIVMYDGEEFGQYQNNDDGIKEFMNEYNNLYDYDEDIEKLEELDYWDEINDIEDFYVCFGSYKRELKEFFITEEAAKKHLKSNIHHYNREKAHIYCSHAWRTPELEKLFQIIEKF